MTQQVFRKQALAHMSSPEQLDQIMMVTSPAGWLSLAGLGLLLGGILLWGFLGSIPTTIEGTGILLPPQGIGAVQAPVPGYIKEVLVEPGEHIATGQRVAVITGPKGQDVSVHAYGDGRVLELRVRVHDRVARDEVLLTMALGGENSQRLQALIYLPPSRGQIIEPDMTMRVLPGTFQVEEYGFMLAKVVDISPFPVSRQAMQRHLGNRELAEQFSRYGAPVVVVAELQVDKNTVSGFRWTSRNGFPGKVTGGTLCRAEVVTRRQSPISLVIPFFDRTER